MIFLGQYKQYFLEEYEVDKLEDIMKEHNANPWDLWMHVNNSVCDLNLAFQVRKQLFLELIEYYMRKGLLRFGREIARKFCIKEYKERDPVRDCFRSEDLVFPYKALTATDIIKLDKNISIEETIRIFGEILPKEGDEKEFQKEVDYIDFEFFLDAHFDCLFPSAYWYYDGEEDEEDMEDMSKKEIEEYKKSCKSLKGDWYNCDTGDGLKDPSKNIYKG